MLAHWLPVPANPPVGNYAFCALVVARRSRSRRRAAAAAARAAAAPALVLASYDWDGRLAFEPSITRLIFVGVILIVLMNARPQGLLGTTRVEIV